MSHNDMFSEILDTNVKIEPIDIEPSLKLNFPVKRGNLQLWQFLLQLIESNSNKNENETKIIEWTRKSSAEFKVLDTKEVARLWGIHKKRPNMSYANVSRSLRFYYKKGITEKVAGEPYGYRFINYKDLYLINPELVEPVNVSKCVNDLENQNSILVQQNSKPNNKRPKTVSVSTTKKLKSATSSSCSIKNSVHRYAPYARLNESTSINNTSAYLNYIKNTNTSQYLKNVYSSSNDSNNTSAPYESNHSLLPSEISSQPNISFNNNSNSSHYNLYQSIESTASSNTPMQYYTKSPTDNLKHHFNQHYYQTSFEYQQQYQASLYNHYYTQKQEYENYYSNLSTASYYKNLASPPISVLVSSTPTTSYLPSTNQYNQFYSPNYDACVARTSKFDLNSTQNNSQFTSGEFQAKQSNYDTYNYASHYYHSKISTPMSLSPSSSLSNSSTFSRDSFANSTSYRNSLDNMSTSIYY